MKSAKITIKTRGLEWTLRRKVKEGDTVLKNVEKKGMKDLSIGKILKEYYNTGETHRKYFEPNNVRGYANYFYSSDL